MFRESIYKNNITTWGITLNLEIINNLDYAYSAVVFDTVVPETRGGELLSDDYSHAVYYTLAHSHNVTWRQGNRSRQRHRTLAKHTS